MSFADVLFVDMCKNVLANGMKTTKNVRPIYKDGESAHTIRSFGVVNRYDLSKEFPAITLYPVNIYDSIKEILWMYQKKTTDLRILGLNVWDTFAYSDYTLGKSYGSQLGKVSLYEEGYFDQVDRALFELKNYPNSRRIVINMFNHSELNEMAVYPCAYSCVLNIINGRLNMLLIQRSSDLLKSNNWNVCQYASLLMMFANSCNLQYGELLHVISDAHIYTKNVKVVNEVLVGKQYKAPSVFLEKKNSFYDYTWNDFEICDYQHGEKIFFEKIFK